MTKKKTNKNNTYLFVYADSECNMPHVFICFECSTNISIKC